MHRTSAFFLGMFVQAVVPLGTTSVPIMYYMYMSYFGLTSGPYAAFIGTAMTSITLFNPLTTIFFMRCYRDVVLPCFKRKAQVVPGTTAITALSAATSVIFSYAPPRSPS